MAAALKWILVIIALAIIAWAVWWSGWLSNLTGTKQGPAQNTEATSTTPAPQAEAQNMNGMSAATDTSDTALAQDAAAIDTQMQGLSSDSANVDSSLNDKSVQ